MKYSIILAATVGAASAATITNYSSATVATINGGTHNLKASVTNPSGALSDGTTIGYGAVGTNGSSRYFHQVSAYRVSDILTTIGSVTIADIANYTFTYTGITEASATDIVDTSLYQVAYVGQWEDSGQPYTNVPLRGTTGNENLENMGNSPTATSSSRTLFSDAGDAISGYTGFGGPGAPAQTINTNVFDLADTAQTLSGSGFDLSSLATSLAADSDLSNNYVFFSFYLNPLAPTGAGAINQAFESVTLEAMVIPEPSTALLGGLGLLALLRRRR